VTVSADTESLLGLLERDRGLLAGEQLERLEQQREAWRRDGIEVVSALDGGYPESLKGVADRPALIFVAGQLRSEDARSVAVIGSRRATEAGEAAAREIAGHLADSGYTVNSGLAAGIDTVAHTEALARGGRTVAVLGTGLRHCYPAENRDLQEHIAEMGAVVSQFWPDTPPRPENFRLRNAVMSALSLATVIVEASLRSGARIPRLSLAQGRPVLLAEQLLAQPWARELADRPGVHAFGSPSEVPALVAGLAVGPRSLTG
jgi:DNA processing protein